MCPTVDKTWASKQVLDCPRGIRVSGEIPPKHFMGGVVLIVVVVIELIRKVAFYLESCRPILQFHLR